MKQKRRPEPEDELDPRDRTLTPAQRLRAAGFVIKARTQEREALWMQLDTGWVMGEREALERFCGGA